MFYTVIYLMLASPDVGPTAKNGYTKLLAKPTFLYYKPLYDLKEEGIDYKLTLGITPILGEQLTDADVLDHFDAYLDEKIAAAEKDIAYFSEESNQPTESTNPHSSYKSSENNDEQESKSSDTTDETLVSEEPQSKADPHLHYLAGWYKNWYQAIKASL